MKKTTLKLFVVALATILLGSSFLAHKKKNENMALSENMVGVWRQVVIHKEQAELTGNYKFLNPDGTFYSMVVMGASKSSFVMMCGNYTITSDSTFNEEIIKHSNPKMRGTESELKYKLLEKNMLLIKYKNSATNKWIPEIWARVPMIEVPDSKKEVEI